MTMIDGKIVSQDGTLCTVNENHIFENANRLAQNIVSQERKTQR